MTRRTAAFGIFALSLLSACSQTPEPVFTISGKLTGHREGSVVLFRQDDLNRRQETQVATIPIGPDGAFSMAFNNEPHLYRLDIYGRKSIDLAIGRGQRLVVSGNAEDLSSVKVSGSDDTAKLEAYESFRKESLGRLVLSVRKQIADLEKAGRTAGDPEYARLASLEITNYDKHRDELIAFVQEKMADSIAAYATTVRWDGGHNLPILESIAAALSNKHTGLAVAERVREKVDLIKRNNIGGTVSEISLPDADGRTVPLSSVKAKYILIDFWASWCAPCRRESPELRAIYDKYRPLGFEIYGVSLDSERDRWVAAIEADKRIWPNVSDLKEYDTPVAFDYSVTAIPASFLIDSDRKVVARNLHGPDLDAKLKSLFGL
ncbi:MAG: AhpC/TSA family protein [Acidobacteria bacterium]|nr:AhpC/TSA family protein [Acidobacteriota bacterium]